MVKALGTRLTYANVMATAAMFVALGGGAYAVSGIPDRGGVLHGCVSNSTGVLRVVKSGSSCHKAVRHGRHRNPGEFAVSWNQQGLPGLQGSQGIQGPKGDIGAAGAPGAPGQDATKLFAFIADQGSTQPAHVEYGNGVTAVTNFANGNYTVTFNRSLEGCVVQVTPGFGYPIPDGGLVVNLPIANASISSNPGQHNQVTVTIQQPSGTSQPSSASVDTSFMITAFC